MEYYTLKWFCFDPDTGVYHLQNDNLKQEEDEDEEQ